MRSKNYDYAEDVDVLYIDNNLEKIKPKWNLPIGNFVVDVASNGKVLGLEVYNASKLLGLSPDLLKNLKVAEIKVMKMGNMVTYGIFVGTSEQKSSLQIVLTKDESDLNHITA